MRRTRLVCLVVLAVLSGLAAPASAQSSLPIAIDQRIRLWTDAADAVAGRVTAVTPAAVQVAVDDRDPMTVATTTVPPCRDQPRPDIAWRGFP